MRVLISRFAFLLAVLLHAAPAWPHARLEKAEPRVGSTVAKAPDEVLLTFSETIDARSSTISVRDAQGTRVDDGAARAESNDAKRLLVTLKPLAAGTYKVEWRATTADTERTQGSFFFTVAP